MKNNKVDREKLYEQLRKLNKKGKNQPKTLKSEYGIFILDQKDKHQRDWYENDEEFEEHIKD